MRKKAKDSLEEGSLREGTLRFFEKKSLVKSGLRGVRCSLKKKLLLRVGIEKTFAVYLKGDSLVIKSMDPGPGLLLGVQKVQVSTNGSIISIPPEFREVAGVDHGDRVDIFEGEFAGMRTIVIRKAVEHEAAT